MTTRTTRIPFTSVPSGWVCHFYHLLTEQEKTPSQEQINRGDFVTEQKTIAVKRARTIGGKRYHGHDYGGGIVFEGNTEEIERKITEAVRAAEEKESQS